jgi:hypothetical protein
LIIAVVPLLPPSTTGEEVVVKRFADDGKGYAEREEHNLKTVSTLTGVPTLVGSCENVLVLQPVGVKFVSSISTHDSVCSCHP